MGIGTPLYERTRDLCVSQRWKEWAGYFAVCRYDHSLDFEYSAIRNRAGLLDVTPLYKYRVRGPGAEALLNRMVPRDVRRAKVGQVLYTPWCDDRGHVVDDGTLQRLARQEFRVTSAYPNLLWIENLRDGLEVSVEDESEATAGLSLQGPCSRAVLAAAGVPDLESLPFFHVREASLAGTPVHVSRTGYTGDLGYEIWIPRERAPEVWDVLMRAGGPSGITPMGLDALDVARIEAGLILIDVDYYSSLRTQIERRKSSAFEIGLGWCVSRNKDVPYIGKGALERQRAAGIPRAIVGLEREWPEVERLFESEDLPIEVHEGACRDAIPVYFENRQVGYATSSCWSPILKKSIALATIDAPCHRVGTRVQIEHTVEYQRRTVTARVVDRPFFDPPRKRS